MVKSNIYYYLFLFICSSLRVIILEDELEKLVSTKETPELTTEAHQVLEQKLKFIQPHIQASNSCWEEAISQVEKMSGRNPNKKGKCERLIWQLMGCTLEMECSNGSKTAFSLCIRILAEEGLTTIHFEKLYTYVKLFHCDDLEAFVSAKNVHVLTQSVRPVDSDCYISRCRLIVAFCL